jgi:putative ABC transport system permease protein
MELLPILSALRRNKAGAVLAVIQIALTVAIVSNIVSIVAARALSISRPSGTQEHELFALGYRLTGGSGDLSTRAADLRSIRAVPGVVDVVMSNSYPLRGTGVRDGLSLAPGAVSIRDQQGQAAVYTMDEHALATLGLKLLEGRDFTAADLGQSGAAGAPAPSVVIVSRALATQLFPQGSALGKLIYLGLGSRTPLLIIGVVERLQTPYAAGTLDAHESENSLILPMASAGSSGLFLVRVKPGALDQTMRDVLGALTATNPQRIFGRLRPFDEIRSSAYQKDRSIAIALGVICLVLVAITAFAIVGLTSFWVVRRRTQIGLRRAMGATRFGIVRYFLIENALLCGAGVAIGAMAAHALNVWLFVHYGTDPLPLSEWVVSAIVVISLGQAAAAFPALRAARTPPTEALRAL